MIFKVICLAVALAVVCARPQDGHNHHHGPAISSQSIVLHQTHETKHEPTLHEQNHEEHHEEKHEEHHEKKHEEHHEEKHQEHHEEKHEEHREKKHEEHHKKHEELHEKKHEEHHEKKHEEHHKKHEENHHEEHHGHASSSQSIKQHHGHATEKHVEYYSHPKYEFEYKVVDPHTGDMKYHHETRDGDVVKGEYSLQEADGTIRIVEYHADKKTGFHANVKHEGHAKHEAPKHH